MLHRETYQGWVIEVWPQHGGSQYPPLYAWRKQQRTSSVYMANCEGHTIADCVRKAKEAIDNT